MVAFSIRAVGAYGHLSLGQLRPLAFAEAHSGPTAVLVDDFGIVPER
jgi:hypothetical protein